MSYCGCLWFRAMVCEHSYVEFFFGWQGALLVWYVWNEVVVFFVCFEARWKKTGRWALRRACVGATDHREDGRGRDVKGAKQYAYASDENANENDVCRSRGCVLPLASWVASEFACSETGYNAQVSSHHRTRLTIPTRLEAHCKSAPSSARAGESAWELPDAVKRRQRGSAPLTGSSQNSCMPRYRRELLA